MRRSISIPRRHRRTSPCGCGALRATAGSVGVETVVVMGRVGSLGALQNVKLHST